AEAAFQQRRKHVQRGERDHQPYGGARERAGGLRLAVVPELSVEQQHGREREDGDGKANEGPAVIMVAEQRRAIAGGSRHDVQQDLPRGEGRAGDGGEKRDGIVAGPQPEADVENRPTASMANWMRCSRQSGQGSSSSRSCAAKAIARTNAMAQRPSA